VAWTTEYRSAQKAIRPGHCSGFFLYCFNEKAPTFSKLLMSQPVILRSAGVEGLEPPTPGFGVREAASCLIFASVNWCSFSGRFCAAAARRTAQLHFVLWGLGPNLGPKGIRPMGAKDAVRISRAQLEKRWRTDLKQIGRDTVRYRYTNRLPVTDVMPYPEAEFVRKWLERQDRKAKGSVA
jgi:hypothetical protein